MINYLTRMITLYEPDMSESKNDLDINYSFDENNKQWTVGCATNNLPSDTAPFSTTSTAPKGTKFTDGATNEGSPEGSVHNSAGVTLTHWPAPNVSVLSSRDEAALRYVESRKADWTDGTVGETLEGTNIHSHYDSLEQSTYNAIKDDHNNPDAITNRPSNGTVTYNSDIRANRPPNDALNYMTKNRCEYSQDATINDVSYVTISQYPDDAIINDVSYVTISQYPDDAIINDVSYVTISQYPDDANNQTSDNTIESNSNESPDHSSDDTSRRSADIDGGYGWVIICATFFVQFIVDGISFSFGIFFLEFLDHFDEGKDTTAWVGSVLNGTYMVMGPVSAALANKFGCRRVCMMGSLLASTGLILSTLSPNIYVLILTYGVFTGVGFGLMYLPSLIMVGFYFEKRRALANGIAMCGSGIGTFIFAPLCEQLIELYSWKGATWIVAGICLNGVTCGALLRPISMSHSKTKPPKTGISSKIPNNKTSKLQPISVISKEDVLDQNYNEVRRTWESKIENMMSVKNPSCLHSSNMLVTSGDVRINGQQLNNGKWKYSDDLELSIFDKQIVKGHTMAKYEDFTMGVKNTSVMTSLPLESKPRDHTSLQKLRTAHRSVVKSFRAMVDLDLLKNPIFCLYGLSCFLCMIGFFVPFVYLPDLAINYGMSNNQAAFLLSIIGIANTIGRVAVGWISDRPWADCLVINSGALIMGGIATLFCQFYDAYPLLGTYSYVFGTSIAAFVALRPILLVEMVGLDNLARALGLIVFCQGLATFIGSPIAGAIYDATGDYNVPFYMAGCTLIMSGSICIPLRRIDLWRQKRALRKKQDGGSNSHAETDEDINYHNSTIFSDDVMMY